MSMYRVGLGQNNADVEEETRVAVQGEASPKRSTGELRVQKWADTGWVGQAEGGHLPACHTVGRRALEYF